MKRVISFSVRLLFPDVSIQTSIFFFLRKIQRTYTSIITDHTFTSALHDIRKQTECIIDLPVKELTVSFTIESYTLPVAIA